MTVKNRLESILTFLKLTDRRDWFDLLQKAAEELNRINASTEQEFLDLGERLQDFYQRTRDISRGSSSIVARMSGKEITDAMDGLKEIINRVERLNSKSREGSAILNTILGKVEEVGGLLDFFTKVVKNLNVLSNLIKIETARILDNDKEFVALVEDIKNLAKDIDSKSSHLCKQAQSLTVLTRRNIFLISDFEIKQQKQCRDILEGTMKNLSALARQHEISAGSLEGMSKQWETISESIGEVVASIQFHDITRQQIEHAVEALNDLEDSGRNCRPDLNRRLLPFLFRSNHRQKPGNVSPQEWAGLTLNTCTLQMAQIHHAGRELFSAVSRIVDNLQSITDQTSRMSDEARLATGAKEQKGRSFLSEMEQFLAALKGTLADYARLNREMEGTMNQVAETVKGMSDFVTEIERIGINMKKVALNAIIHAAHIGDEGRPLSVLSESVHQLSVNTTEQINSIAANLKGVITTSDQLTQNVQSEAEGKWQGSGALVEHLEGMVRPLRELDKDVIGLVADVEASGKSFQGEMERTIQGITVHSRVCREIGNVYSILENLVNDLGRRFPQSLKGDPSTELLALAGRYTMDQEREIHRALIHADPISPHEEGLQAGIETEEKLEVSGKKETEDFGDNVELF